MDSDRIPTLYNIPASIPFAKSLAKALLSEYSNGPEDLANIRIFLPTKRGCRTLSEAFLELSDSKALILPRMHAIGNVDEEELSLSQFAEQHQDDVLSIPPAISPLKRQILLARMIQAMDNYQQSFDHALTLAKALGHFMDHIYTEDLSLDNLHDLVPENFAEHWQITLDFLKVISEHWPKILKENNVIDATDRRNRLIKSLTQHWEYRPPHERIIAAGSTGSIPATSAFLNLIANIENGSVILPGLDQDMDEDSWQSLTETHPQYGLRKLLRHMCVERKEVKLLDNNTAGLADKQFLATEIMRPPETTKNWTDLSDENAQKRIVNALQNTSLIVCKNPQEEANTIGIIIREALEKPDQSVALITPDRNLAKRVQTICRRWDINVDDSAGYALYQTSLGQFFNILLQINAQNFPPVLLAALLKHSYFRLSENSNALAQLEIAALRGLKPEGGIEALLIRLQKTDIETEEAQDLLKRVQHHFAPFTPLVKGKHHFKTFLNAHLKIAESLSGEDRDNEQSILWSRDEGEAASEIISQLIDETGDMPHLDFAAYMNVFSHFVGAQLVRPRYGTHPRIHILGQLEARLIYADIIIMSSLNEGKWPRDQGHDPWMSRGMQANFGLPNAEHNIGLSAHDFVQGFCAKKVIMTRPQTDGKNPTLPSRWLQRIDKVLEAAKLSIQSIKQTPYQDWGQQMDGASAYKPSTRPSPRPPENSRPRALSATRIEIWMQDPYSIYAAYILKLKPMNNMEEPIGHATRGTLIHSVFQRFIDTYKHELPENSEEKLKHIMIDVLNSDYDNLPEWEGWIPRIQLVIKQFLDIEQEWRKIAAPIKTEIRGEITLNGSIKPFTLSAKADRIDTLDNGLCIIDYKSSTQFTKKTVINGNKPQLAIEALIAHGNGYSGINQNNVSALQYWLLPGSYGSSKVVDITDDLGGILERTKEGITKLIAAFDKEDTPYYSVPDPGFAPAYNDYEHLSRINEWIVLDQKQGT